MKSMCKGAVLAALAGAFVLTAGGVAAADSDATGAAIGSPGLLSGNVVQIPIDIPVNACGNSINVIGILNPAFGNTCVNVSDHDRSATKAHRTAHGSQEGRNGRRHDKKDDDCK